MAVLNASTGTSYTLASGLGGTRAGVPDCLGNVWIADANSNAVKLWNATTRVVTTIVTSSTFSTPKGIAIDPGMTTLFIASNIGAAVITYKLATGALATLYSGAGNAFGIILNASGALIVNTAVSGAMDSSECGV